MRYANQYGFYELNPFPGCNQIVVSNHAFIYPEFRGKGLGQVQHEERREMARSLGYDVMLCTVRADNETEIHILNKRGWNKMRDFTSTETGHRLQLWERALRNA